MNITLLLRKDVIFPFTLAFNSFNARRQANLLYDLVKCVCVSCFCFNVTILMDEHNKQAQRSMLAHSAPSAKAQSYGKNVKSNCGGHQIFIIPKFYIVSLA